MNSIPLYWEEPSLTQDHKEEVHLEIRVQQVIVQLITQENQIVI